MAKRHRWRRYYSVYITDLSDIQISFDGYGYDAGADGRVLARLHNPLPIDFLSGLHRLANGSLIATVTNKRRSADVTIYISERRKASCAALPVFPWGVRCGKES